MFGDVSLHGIIFKGEHILRITSIQTKYNITRKHIISGIYCECCIRGAICYTHGTRHGLNGFNANNNCEWWIAARKREIPDFHLKQYPMKYVIESSRDVSIALWWGRLIINMTFICTWWIQIATGRKWRWKLINWLGYKYVHDYYRAFYFTYTQHRDLGNPEKHI